MDYLALMDLFLTNTQLSGVFFYLDSHSDGTHCKSIGEQVMQCYISPKLMKKQTHLHFG